MPADILIVDDEVPIAEVLAEALHDEGYRVKTLHDGASALLEIAARRPRLVLLDITMPVMNGLELLRYLRGHGYGDLPIIVMTAELRPERYLDYGATGVLAKPFEIDELLDLVVAYAPPVG